MSSDSEFVKATSFNLPVVDAAMLLDFLTTDEQFNTSEVRRAKAVASGRESYGDSAVGYVELKRVKHLCTVRARICPEHKVRNKPYSVEVVVDEEESKILNISCNDCAAAVGGCKHSLAFLMWIHRRTEEPSCTEVASYWMKPRLSIVGSTTKCIKVNELKKRKLELKLPSNSSFKEQLVSMAKTMNIDSQLSRYNFGSDPNEKFMPMSLYHSLLIFLRQGGSTFDEFVAFTNKAMTPTLIEEAEIATRNQSRTPLWQQLRFGRITASKMYDVARCKTEDGCLVASIIGAYKLHETLAIRRGGLLKKQVFDKVEKHLGIKLTNCGLSLIMNYPIFGASPDGMGPDFIIEIKCPRTTKTMKNYIKQDGSVSEKCKAQMQLQMFATKVEKGILCVAHPDFEESGNIKYVWVHIDNNYIQELLQTGIIFWKNVIFSKLLKSLSN